MLIIGYHTLESLRTLLYLTTMWFFSDKDLGLFYLLSSKTFWWVETAHAAWTQANVSRCGGLTAANSQAPTQALTHSNPQQDGGENKWKSDKTRGLR